MDRGVLTEDVLGREDGPYAGTAAAFLDGSICEECFLRPAVLDDLCGECVTEALRDICIA